MSQSSPETVDEYTRGYREGWNDAMLKCEERLDGLAQCQQDSALRELIEFWIYDGRLQTFEDRERFRKAARAALADTSTDREGK